VPPNVWSYQGFPLGVVTQCAEAIGAVVEAHRTAMSLTVRSRYPVMPNEWAGTVPDLQVAWAAVENETTQRADQPAYNSIIVAGQTEGALVQVRLAGTSGADQAPMLTNSLLTDNIAAEERARAVLGASGKTLMVTRALPLVSGVGVVNRGSLVRWVDSDATWCGMVRAVSVQASLGVARQSVTCERRLEFPVGVYVPKVVQVEDPDLISLMHFEDADGTAVPADEKSILTWSNNISFHTVGGVGKFGKGFNRVQDNVNGGIAGGLRVLNTSVLVGKTEFSAELFIRITGNPFGINGNKRFLNLGNVVIHADSKFTIGFGSSTSPTYVEGTDYHVCVEMFGGTLYLFVDGTVVATIPNFTFTGFTTPMNIGVGCNPGGNGDYYIGMVDEWRLMARAVRKGNAFTPPTEPYTIYK